MSASIASSFSSCLGAYQDLVAALAESSPPVRDEISLSELEDELGRLKVWAGNIAAHKVGRSSLDFRLRDASPLRDRIIGLLQDMESLVGEAIPVATGDRKGRDDTASDNDSSDGDDSDDQGSSPDQPEHRPTTELQQTLLDIVDIIDCLYKLSITIRNPSPHDRLVKATTVDTSFYEQWDIEHVKNKFPAAKEYLTIKLGKAISRRRQYLKYREKHRKKLGQDLVSPPKPAVGLRAVDTGTKTIPTIVVPSGEFNDPTTTILPISEAPPSIIATTVLTQTTASEFFGGNAEFEVESDSGQTQTSYATSVGHEGSLSIPSLPKESQGGKPFECPYCFTIISVKNSHSWKKHIFRDLQPYVCTFDSCSKGSKMFDSRREWFDHELLSHRKEWYCTADCEKSFVFQSDFEDHMRQTHSSTFSEHQLGALVDICQRPVEENSKTQCPLCTETVISTKQLCRHLARHLEALAMFALPQNKDEDKEEVFGSDRVQLSDASRGLSDGNLSFSSKSQSAASKDSGFDNEIVGHEEISKFLDGFEDSEKLAPSFMHLFQQQLRDFLNTSQDSIVLQIFEDVEKVIFGPDFQQVMDSGSNIKDIISLFYLEATTSCEMHQTEGDDSWINSVDQAAAHFIQLMARTVATTSYGVGESGLVVRLEALRNKLLVRSSRKQMLREKKATETLEQPKEADGLLNPDWAKCWGMTEDEKRKFPDQEIALQQNIHSIWTSERTYLEGLDTLMTLYHDDLINNPSITDDGKRFEFIEKVFSMADRIRKIHEPLLESLKVRLLQQGPFVQLFSGIFRDWLKPEVKEAYFAYAREFPSNELLIQRTMKKNPQFRQAFEGDSSRIDWLKYLRNPLGRIQQCIRLLIAVHGTTLRETEESRQLQLDIDEMQTFYSAFESQVQKGVAKASRIELAGKLILRRELEGIELNLEDEHRQLFYKGDLIRKDANDTMLSTFACLFDNYFILATPMKGRNTETPIDSETDFEVRKLIPMSLLLLEDSNEEPIPPTQTTATRGAEAALLCPFRVKHLGKLETYTLCTRSLESKITWCEQIIAAIQAHASNEELNSKPPFSLNVLADTAFQPRVFEAANRNVRIKGSALDKAIENFRRDDSPQPLGIRADVTCATTFNLPGVRLVAVGTEEGFSVCKADNPRGWTRTIKLSSVKQMFVIEEFNIFVVLASGALWAYRADAIWDYFDGSIAYGSSGPKIPQRTEIAKSANFFVAGQMKDRSLLVYAKKEGLHTTFKVLEPIYHKPIKKGIFSFRGSSVQTPEFFREFDKFFIPMECSGINMFKQYFAVSHTKGFEVLMLDKKVPYSVPQLKSSNVLAIAECLQNQRPLGMFRNAEDGFFCCYEETGVYVDKHGEISKSVVMEFVGNAKKAAVDHQYIMLFSNDFVEIRDLLHGKLCQVIAGQNIRCLDAAEGGFSKRNVLMVMAHPDLEDRQLVLELQLEKLEHSEA